MGWAPVAPGDGGYAYGAPISYEPPVAEAWVFVEPRYVASPLIYQYYVPIPRLNAVFLNATTVYHPEFRGGAVFNVGIPRETVVKITNRPVVVEKIVKVQNQANIYEKGGGGIKVFAPPVAKGKPEGMPKHFVDSPSEFKTKAKLTATVAGTPPKGLGPTAATIKPIASEVRPEEFKKHVMVGASPGPTGTGPIQGQTPTSAPEQGRASTESGPGGPGKKKEHAGPGPGFPAGPGGPGGPGAAGQPGSAEGGPARPGGPGGPGEHKGRLGGPGGPGQPGDADQANIRLAPAGPGGPGENKDRLGGPGGPGGPGQPGAAGQANIQGRPGGPGEHKGRPAGPRGPGAPGQPGGAGQANIQGAPAGPGGPGGRKVRANGKPEVCNQNPDLPVCKEKQ